MTKILKVRERLLLVLAMMMALIGAPAVATTIEGYASADGATSMVLSLKPGEMLAGHVGLSVTTTSRYDLKVIGTLASKGGGGTVGNGLIPIIDAMTLDEQHRPVAVVNDHSWPIDTRAPDVAGAKSEVATVVMRNKTV